MLFRSAQHDWDVCYHLAGHYIIICSEGFACGMLGCMWDFLFFYLVVDVGALSILMVYRAHGGTG